MKILSILSAAAALFATAYFAIRELLTSGGWYEAEIYPHWFLALTFFVWFTHVLRGLIEETEL